VTLTGGFPLGFALELSSIRLVLEGDDFFNLASLSVFRNVSISFQAPFVCELVCMDISSQDLYPPNAFEIGRKIVSAGSPVRIDFAAISRLLFEYPDREPVTIPLPTQPIFWSQIDGVPLSLGYFCNSSAWPSPLKLSLLWELTTAILQLEPSVQRASQVIATVDGIAPLRILTSSEIVPIGIGVLDDVTLLWNGPASTANITFLHQVITTSQFFFTTRFLTNRSVIFDSPTFQNHSYRLVLFSPNVFLRNIRIDTGDEFFIEGGGLMDSVCVSSTSFLRLVEVTVNNSDLTIEFDIASRRTAVRCSGSSFSFVPRSIRVNVFLSQKVPDEDIEHNALIVFADQSDSLVEQWLARIQLNTSRVSDGERSWLLSLALVEIGGSPAISVEVGIAEQVARDMSPTALFGIICGIIAGGALVIAIVMQIRRWLHRPGQSVRIERLDEEIVSDDL
jgi:hypothetical protein